MEDYCIENDFATQREMADIHRDNLTRSMDEFNEYKDAMESYFGKSKCVHALEQYRIGI